MRPVSCFSAFAVVLLTDFPVSFLCTLFGPCPPPAGPPTGGHGPGWQHSYSLLRCHPSEDQSCGCKKDDGIIMLGVRTVEL